VRRATSRIRTGHRHLPCHQLAVASCPRTLARERDPPGIVIVQQEGATTTFIGVTIAGLAGTHDLTVERGKIVALAPSRQAGGGFITPLLADCHVHLDKTYTIERIRRSGPAKVDCLFDAIDL